MLSLLAVGIECWRLFIAEQFGAQRSCRCRCWYKQPCRTSVGNRSCSRTVEDCRLFCLVGSSGCKAMRQLLKLKPSRSNFRTMKPKPSTTNVADVQSLNSNPMAPLYSTCRIQDLRLFFKPNLSDLAPLRLQSCRLWV